VADEVVALDVCSLAIERARSVSAAALCVLRPGFAIRPFGPEHDPDFCYCALRIRAGC
jgi:hypothetical protein